MARKFYVLAVYLMAASIGVLGYQIADYLIDGSWPVVPTQVVWRTFFGSVSRIRHPVLYQLLHLFGNLPAVMLGVVLAYLCFLTSDIFRRR